MPTKVQTVGRAFPLYTEASAAKTVTGNSTEFKLPDEVTEVWVAVDVTAFSGTAPTLTVALQQKNANGVWHNVDITGTINTVSQNSLHIKTKVLAAGQNARLRWEIGGATPSFTSQIGVTGR